MSFLLGLLAGGAIIFVLALIFVYHMCIRTYD